MTTVRNELGQRQTLGYPSFPAAMTHLKQVTRADSVILGANWLICLQMWNGQWS